MDPARFLGLVLAPGNLVIAYLFLGGTGAGVYLCAVFREFASRLAHCLVPADSRQRNGCAARLPLGYATAFVVLALGASCLLLDLLDISKAHLLFLSPTLSWISVGSYALSGLLVCSLLQFYMRWSHRRLPLWVDILLCALGVICAFWVVAYTGFFLRSLHAAAPSWGTLWVPLLFALSSFSAGLALYLAVMGEAARFEGGSGWGLRVDSVLIAGEALAAVAYLGWCAMESPASCNVLLRGNCSGLFLGGFVLCGLVLPWCISFASRKCGRDARNVLAVLQLFGSACLRASIVWAPFS